LSEKDVLSFTDCEKTMEVAKKNNIETANDLKIFFNKFDCIRMNNKNLTGSGCYRENTC
jgi:hypothetical protein